MAAGFKASLQEKRLLPGASELFWATLLLYTVRGSLKASSIENWAIPFLKCFTWIYLKSSWPWLHFACLHHFPEKWALLAIPPCQAPSSEHKSKPVATINFCSDLWKSSAQSTQFHSQAKNLYSSWTVQSSLQDLLSRMEATSFKATVTLAQPRTFRIDVTAVQFLHLKHITTLRPPKSMRVLD